MMFGWIPIIGPIIDGIVSIFTKYEDTALGKYKTDATVSISAMKTSADIIRDTKDDIGVRLSRDLIIFPVAVWCAILSWDTIIIGSHPEWTLKVVPFPPTIEYLPLAVIGFLLGQTALMRLGRR